MKKTAAEPSSQMENEAPLPADRAFVVQLRAQRVSGITLFEGRIEHIASGEAARFSSSDDLLAFMAKVLRTPPGSPADPRNPTGSAG